MCSLFTEQRLDAEAVANLQVKNIGFNSVYFTKMKNIGKRKNVLPISAVGENIG